jgi:hypothetical protein
MTLLRGYDSTKVSDMPVGGDFYLGYIDGLYVTYPEAVSWFPTSRILSVTVRPQTQADIGDCETQDLTPAQAADSFQKRFIKAIYCNLSTFPEVVYAMGGYPFNWWAANPNGIEHIVPGSFATQWAWPSIGSPGHYDISSALSLHVFDQAPELPTTYKGKEMIARNTAGKGYWAVRPSGDVYSYDDAPYLGPLPKYLQEWGIGTATTPVVGITDDGHGGYVLVADANQYPGEPALYRIPSDGQYAH